MEKLTQIKQQTFIHSKVIVVMMMTMRQAINKNAIQNVSLFSSGNRVEPPF